MRVAVIQSNYIPWKGYFDIIGSVDLFLFYDDVQYTKHDWRNRNQIKTDQGLRWLTIPVGDDLNRRICDVRIPDARWQKRHWKTIRQTYARCRFFPTYREMLEEFYLGRRWPSLSEANRHLIERLARSALGITTELRTSLDYRLSGTGAERLLDLLLQVGAKQYLSGPRARAYLPVEVYRQAGVAVEFADYSRYPVYPQHHPPFVHQVSILDLLFQVGPEAPRYIWGEGGGCSPFARRSS